ncbi:hypothetical protein B484DRAFT_467148, partial [Ochromonadaceae sp. CCMP2298]
MSGGKTEKRYSRGNSASVTVNVLESTSEPGWVFQNWKVDAENEFKSQNLHGYLDNEISSAFDDPIPEFRWLLETATLEVCPAASSPTISRSRPACDIDVETGGSGDYEGDLGAAELQMDTPMVQLSSFLEQGAAVTEPYFRRSKTLGHAQPARSDGYREVITRSSPETEGVVMAAQLHVAPSVEFYYSRLDAYHKQVSERGRKQRFKDEVVTEASDLLKSMLSAPVRAVLETSIASRDLSRIWREVQQLCGPRSSNEGLAELEKKWSTTTISASETMPVFLQRLLKIGRGFDAYSRGFAKTDLHYIILVREALKTSKFWKEFEFEIRDADRCGEGWGQLQTRLLKRSSELSSDAKGSGEKALAAQPEVKQLVKRAITEERKKIKGAGVSGDKAVDQTDSKAGAGAGDPSSRGGRFASRAAQLTCFLCAQFGHVVVDCPHADRIAAFQKTLKSTSPAARPEKPLLIKDAKKQASKATAAAATQDQTDASDGDGGDEDEFSGVAASSEPFDDWLGKPPNEHSCVAMSSPLDGVLADETSSGGAVSFGVSLSESGAAPPGTPSTHQELGPPGPLAPTRSCIPRDPQHPPGAGPPGTPSTHQELGPLGPSAPSRSCTPRDPQHPPGAGPPGTPSTHPELGPPVRTLHPHTGASFPRPQSSEPQPTGGFSGGFARFFGGNSSGSFGSGYDSGYDSVFGGVFDGASEAGTDVDLPQAHSYPLHRQDLERREGFPFSDDRYLEPGDWLLDIRLGVAVQESEAAGAAHVPSSPQPVAPAFDELAVLGSGG